jgi:hypothetical protein
MEKDRFVKVYLVYIDDGLAGVLDGVYSAEVLANQRVAEIKKKGENASVVDMILNQKGRH